MMKASIFDGYNASPARQNYNREKQWSNLTQAFINAPAGTDISGHVVDALRYGYTQTPGWWQNLRKRTPVFWEKYCLCQ